MITSKDIDDAVHYGTERNLDKEARELTEHYLLDKLGIHSTKKIQRRNR